MQKAKICFLFHPPLISPSLSTQGERCDQVLALCFIAGRRQPGGGHGPGSHLAVPALGKAGREGGEAMGLYQTVPASQPRRPGGGSQQDVADFRR